MRFLLFIFLFTGHFCIAQNEPVYALLENGDLESITEMISSMDQNNSIVSQAYLGSLYCRRAAYQKEPKNKKADFKLGAEILEKCILEEPMNVEIRFLRYIIQTKSPKFLGYHHNIREDKNVIEKNTQSISGKLKTIIEDFNQSNLALSIDV